MVIERWDALISEVASLQPDREDGVKVGNLFPTSKLLKVTQAKGVRDLDSTPLQQEMRLFEATCQTDPVTSSSGGSCLSLTFQCWQNKGPHQELCKIIFHKIFEVDV